MGYEQDRREAAKDIRNAPGKALTLRFPGISSLYAYSYDPVLGDTWTLIASPFTVVHTDPGSTPVDYAVHGLELSYQDKDYDGERIKVGDRRFMVAALDDSGVAIPKPNVGGTLYVGTSSGTALTIVTVDPFEPGDTALYYTVQARG